MQKKQLPFWLFAASLILALTLPVLIQDGMFMDAVFDTAISKNLGNGIGSFWLQIFSKYGLGGTSTIHEQPPLVFGIQSIFFKLLGNSMYTERVYVFLTMLITALLIVAIWKQINKNLNEYYIGWLPLILWIIIPVCFWSFSNNMHENTMGIFILLSVLFYLKFAQCSSLNIIYLLCSAVCIFFASFSKGIPGFFPIVTPFLYWLCFKNISFKRMFENSLVLTFIPILIYLILFVIPESNESLSYYFKRVSYRINDVPTVDSHFYIIYRLFTELIPSLAFVTILFFTFKINKKYKPDIQIIKSFLFFLLLGLAGSVPLMLTKVQKGFYFIPSLPFFAIGLSLLIAKPIATLSFKFIEIKRNKIFTILTVLLLSSVIIFSATKIGKQGRDKDTLHDIYLIGKQVKEGSLVSIPNEMWNDWSLQSYLICYFNISLDPISNKNDYLIIEKKMFDKRLPEYHKLSLQTMKYDLYKKVNF